MNREQPTFVGIGVQKAGTTWLAKCLSEHPGVFVPSIKETMYFSYRYSGDIGGYEEYFSDGSMASARGEFCTLYFSDPEAPARIHYHYPGIRLILILRNPADQLYSHYWHLASQNFHSDTNKAFSFKEALEQFPERLISPALYGRNLGRWLALFPRDRLHVMLYDELKADRREALEKVYRFIGVDGEFVPPSFGVSGSVVRSGAAPRGEMAARLHRSLYRFLKRRAFDPLVHRVGTDVAWRLKDRLKVRRILQTVFYSASYPVMAPAVRRDLTAMLLSEIEQAEQLLRMDLTAWKGLSQ